jgi:hypothetical protein
MTASDAMSRLSDFNIDHEGKVAVGHVRTASDRLDRLGPYLGEKYSATQARQFPRSVQLDGELAGAVPDPIKDWIALEAWKRASPNENAEVASTTLAGAGGVVYARPLKHVAQTSQEGILARYQEIRVKFA